MNWFFFAAAILLFIVGLVHSVLGEQLIFRHMRTSGIIPTNGGSILHESHVRILWASWHVATVLGWCVSVVLMWLGQIAPSSPGALLAAKAIVTAMAACSLLVLVGTKGRHLGWVGFLGIVVLVSLGLYV